MDWQKTKERIGEALILATLLASIAGGIMVGLMSESHRAKGGEEMKKDMQNLLFAVFIIWVVAMMRMVFQIHGVDVLISHGVHIGKWCVLDMTQLARVVYVPIEMIAALVAAYLVSFFLQRLKMDISAIGWIGSMFVFMSLLGVLGQSPIDILAIISAIAVIFGWYCRSEKLNVIWDGLKRGIVVGCLLGASIRYGFTIAVIIATAAWVVREAGMVAGRKWSP